MRLFLEKAVIGAVAAAMGGEVEPFRYCPWCSQGLAQTTIYYKLKSQVSLRQQGSPRAELGIDGNCGYALLGPDLQEGEADFVEMAADDLDSKLLACKLALHRLRERLKMPDLAYYYGKSHPYGRD
jgi:hypothetical protein